MNTRDEAGMFSIFSRELVSLGKMSLNFLL